MTTRSFDGAETIGAIAATFENRETPVPGEVPEGLSARAMTDDSKLLQWAAFVKRMRLDSDVPPLLEVVAIVGGFASPVFEALRASTRFDLRWNPPGPWNDNEPLRR